jgi:hypothetical protein
MIGVGDQKIGIQQLVIIYMEKWPNMYIMSTKGNYGMKIWTLMTLVM